MELVIRDNVRDVIKRLDSFQRKQVPFAMSRALNDTAVDSQEKVVQGVINRFNNRKKWWVKGNRRTGIRVDFSNKRNLVAAVYTNAYFAKIQEDGGIKKPTGKYLGVPTPHTPKRLHKSTGMRDATQMQRVFFTRTSSSVGAGLWQRKGKKANPIRPLYFMVHSARVAPRMRFGDTVEREAERKIRANFERRLQQALASAKI